MNPNRSFALLRTTAALTALCLLGTTAKAQNDQSAAVQGQEAAQVGMPTTQNTGQKRNHMIRLRKVLPSLMAYWLDPANNQAPKNLAVPRPSVHQEDGAGQPVEAFKLPEGVDRIVAIDPQNAILVFGTDEGVRAVQDLLVTLDRPLRQVEIECQFVRISDEDLKAFGIDSLTQGAKEPTVHFVRGNFQSTLLNMVTQKKATVLSASRMTAINNLEASVASTNGVQVSLDLRQNKKRLPQGATVEPLPDVVPLLVSSGYEIKATPTVNNDDTVTVIFAVKRLLSLGQGKDKPSIDLSQDQGTNAVFNLRDGDTVAIKTVDKNSTEAETGTVLFVTAAIIRRADEN